MKEFEYKVSIIVPIFNTEKYLRGCIDSLLTQTMDLKFIEILLIDDGSTDKSLEICEEYSKYFESIKVYTQENSGCSAARNLGIKKAKGKYIMYLDSDDSLAPETLKCVTDFFDKHYDEVDLVCYYDQAYKEDKPLPPHMRYKYLTKTGVYDLTTTIFATQVRLNICVKNQFENNLYFDNSMNYQEDQKYCCQILKDKMKLGYCKEGKYHYNRNETSIVGTQTYAYYMFEQSTKYFEDLFSEFDVVPAYFQALYIHDISWKLTQHCLFPYHYQGQEFQNAINRIIRLLRRIDVKTIMNHPSVDYFHKFYFLQLRNKKEITLIAEPHDLNLVCGTKNIYKTKSVEIIVSKFRVYGEAFSILAYIKSPIYNFIDDLPEVYAKIQTDEGEQIMLMDLVLSSDSYYKAREITNRFWSFFFEGSLNGVKSISFFVKIDGIIYDTHYYFMPRTPFNQSIKRKEFIQNKIHVEVIGNVFYFTKKSKEFLDEINEKLDQISGESSVSIRRKMARALSKKRIWLYYDCKGVAYDNGYYQFCHDIKKNDGIERYYILNNEISFVEAYFSENLKKYVVQFGSEQHKRLLIACEKIITAFIEETNIYPFTVGEKKFYTDLFHFEVIYLQHGILHAHLPWKYTPERSEIDKIIVSSYFEKENFQQVYHFREKDILPFGMPRFQYMKKTVKSTKRILLAPSWRQYLIGENKSTGEWIPTKTRFLKSNFYLKIQEFLNHSKLHKMLEENDLYLDFKLHPIFKIYQDCFELISHRIVFADDTVKDEEYAIFVTDFSSFVFDFAYLEKPIVYFVPDYEEFLSGMNQYRELDLPFDKAFGKLVLDVDAAVDELERIINRGMKVEEKFRERMKKFYIPMTENSEKIYQYLIGQKI